MTPEEEFASSDIVHTMGNAPRDGTPIVARDGDGDIALIRWRAGADLDEGEPYWARWDTDEPFEPVAWVPTRRTIGDLLKQYG